MADFLIELVGLSGGQAWIGYALAALVHCAILLSVVAGAATLFIWMERKVAGRIQDRLGPTRVGGKFGWLQLPADGLKLFTKEDVAPAGADQLLFRLAPYISFAASFGAYFALPFANGWAAQQINVAVFFIVAVLGLEVFGIILAGYGSGSKWSLFGAMREAAQVVSYEVPLGLCVVVPVLLCGTMDLTTIANMQAGWFTNWLIFHDPFTFCLFWIYFTCAVASVNRAPFDLAEAESELVAGFHTEYSGLRWSFFFMAEYSSMFLVSGLAAILFLGGWHGPIPIFDIIGWSCEPGATAGLTGHLANLAGCVNFLFKAILGVTAMMWARWTLPRLRIDQVITACLKYCAPLAAVCFLGALAWRFLGPPFLNDLAPAHPRRAVREAWMLAAPSGGEPRAAAQPTQAAIGWKAAAMWGASVEDEALGPTNSAARWSCSQGNAECQAASGRRQGKRAGLDVLPLATRPRERGRESFSAETATTWENVWPKKRTPEPFPPPIQRFALENDTVAVNVARCAP